jgi:hypothetical protein
MQLAELFLDTFGLGWYTMLNNGQSLVPNLPWLTEESLRASIAEDSPYKKYFPKKSMSAVCIGN